MQKPDVNASSAVHAEFADYIEGAVEAWSDAEVLTSDQKNIVQEVAALITPAINTLRASMDASEAAERAVSKARARFRVRDVVLDLRVMGTSDSLLNGPAARNRESALYRQVFLDGTAHSITSGTMRDEPDVVERLLARLDKVGDYEGKATARKLLAEALEKSLAARKDLDVKVLDASKASDAERQARLNLHTVVDQVYGKLRAAFPGQREFIESFFPKRGRTDARKLKADTPAKKLAAPVTMHSAG